MNYPSGKIFNNFIKSLVGISLSLSLFCCVGGGTDIDNALVEGQVTLAGTPLAKVSVYCMHSEYNPMKESGITKTWSTVTDSDGQFEMNGLPAGRYSMEFRFDSLKHMDWKPDWGLKDGEVREINSELKKAHYLKIKVHDSLITEDLYLYIPGSNAYSLAKDYLVDSTHVVLEYVAETNIPFILYGYAFDPEFVSQVLVRDIPAPLQDTVYVIP